MMNVVWGITNLGIASINGWNKKRKWDAFKHEKNGGRKYYVLLQSLCYSNQTYGALNKSWVGFVIAKEHGEWEG